MSKKTKTKMKSVRFKQLLPAIYEKLIIEHLTHTEVSEWLKEEHDLDLLGKDNDGKPFSNYLSIYGAIKTAKESYAGNVENKEIVAQHWYDEIAKADTKKTTKPFVVNEQAQPNDVAEPQKPKSIRISETLRASNNKKVSAKSILSDFENKGHGLG
jgi:hypothetical protein